MLITSEAISHQILKENAQPVIHPIRRVALALMPKLKECLKELIKEKIIEKVEEAHRLGECFSYNAKTEWQPKNLSRPKRFK